MAVASSGPVMAQPAVRAALPFINGGIAGVFFDSVRFWQYKVTSFMAAIYEGMAATMVIQPIDVSSVFATSTRYPCSLGGDLFSDGQSPDPAQQRQDSFTIQNRKGHYRFRSFLRSVLWPLCRSLAPSRPSSRSCFLRSLAHTLNRRRR
jgi:hypothetical protein